jgi:hypothetical protein
MNFVILTDDKISGWILKSGIILWSSFLTVCTAIALAYLAEVLSYPLAASSMLPVHVLSGWESCTAVCGRARRCDVDSGLVTISTAAMFGPVM